MMQLVTGCQPVTKYQYDAANRLTTASGVNYTFDANGNLLSDEQNTHVYDSANRLTSVSGQSTVNSIADLATGSVKP
jgi:hypothetical protein